MEGLDDKAHALLQTQLDSFEKLELVRVLRASGKPMSEASLDKAARLRPDVSRDAVIVLLQIGVLRADPGTGLIELGPASVDPAFQALMAVYEQDRLLVLTALSSLALARIRNMAARTFGDAFVPRKRGDDGDD